VLASEALSAGNIAAVIAIGTFVAASVGGAVAYLLRRREKTGSIRTSDAGVLWEQAQKMRAELEAQRDKAMEQRDRLIESQSSQVLPVLQLVIDSLRQITESLARLEGTRRTVA
jgi:uncharacterized membrane protein